MLNTVTESNVLQKVKLMEGNTKVSIMQSIICYHYIDPLVRNRYCVVTPFSLYQVDVPWSKRLEQFDEEG